MSRGPQHERRSELLRLARAARRAIRGGADPALMLSYVVWPTDAVQRAAGR